MGGGVGGGVASTRTGGDEERIVAANQPTLKGCQSFSSILQDFILDGKWFPKQFRMRL